MSDLAVHVTAILSDELEEILRLHRLAQDVVNTDLQSPKLHILIKGLVCAEGEPRVMEDLGGQAVSGIVGFRAVFVVVTRFKNAYIRPMLLVFNLSYELVSLLGIHLLDCLVQVPSVVRRPRLQLEQDQLDRVQAALSLFTPRR